MSVHRVRIHADRDGDPVAVDVALPSTAPVGELLPAILDLVGDRSPAEAIARGWRLDRPTGDTLLDSLSLIDNEIQDGELLILAPDEAPPLGLMHLEPCRQAAATRPPHVEEAWLPGAVCVLAATVAAAALVMSGVGTHSPVNLVVTAIGACAAAAAALTVPRPTALGTAGVALAAATGFLAVPSGPGAPNAFLAAAAGFATSLLLLRITGHPSPAWSGTAALSVAIAVATVLPMPVVAVGSVLGTASLGIMALAPRIAVAVAGLGPEHWTDEMDARAAVGHATLTGLVAGCALGASTGALLVAFATLRWGASPASAVVFTALVGLVLALQARTHADRVRQRSLEVTGLLCTASSFVVGTVTHPGHVGWAGGALIVLAVMAGRRPRTGAAAARLADRLEYVALAAVVPVALWVGGAYALLGAVRLS